MSSARLLIPLVMACSLCAVGQSQRSKPTLASSNSDAKTATAFPDLQTRAATPSEPWRIIPQNAERSSSLRFLPDSGNDHIAISLAGNSSDGTCYAIRSYVVARDSQSSEATHPVAYSTCQPASRYQLRNTVLGSDSPGQ